MERTLEKNQDQNQEQHQELGAWLLPIDESTSVAIGRYELKYIEYINASVRLPGLPSFCEQGFLWRNHFIPALDVHQLVARRRESHDLNEERMVAIIAYENAKGKIELGAIFLRGIPRLLPVKPDQSVALSNLAPTWQLLAHAAFQEGEQCYPVLDLRGLFDKTPADLLSMH